MPDGNEISVDHKVANTLASQLANENLGLRQDAIRLSMENQELQQKIAELEEASSKKK